MNESDELSSSAFLNVFVTLVLFLEENQDTSIPIWIIKAVLQHYNILL
ncbi:Hypothetical protein LUCI_0304 [Lucifera butyrica]|uniref:Uncharacterized protein n=1 Tax=Lucifera butyrica TaxID=1351585 RepID=A0A498R7J6_9FIRM|nr:Hypothetical protein LUCI_0304 [Lucifera butyrica]